MTAIYKRELKSLFSGMIAPVFMAFLLLMAGIYTCSVNFGAGYPEFERVISGISFIFLIIVPILTMRSFSEERAARTDQLLYTLPIRTSAVVAGKYLAMVTVLGISTLILCLYPLILSVYGDVYFVTAYASIFAFFLVGCALIAIGMFISSLTESQVISAVLTLGVFILLYLMNNISAMILDSTAASFALFILLCIAAALLIYVMTKNAVTSAAVGTVLVVAASIVYVVKSSLFEGAFEKMLNSLAVFSKTYSFMYGVFDIGAVVYYVTVILLFGFLTVQSVDKKRWN